LISTAINVLQRVQSTTECSKAHLELIPVDAHQEGIVKESSANEVDTFGRLISLQSVRR
jgi:hypothetical protein